MRVAVIGAGGMGGGIAKLLAGSHDVAVGSRDAAKGAQQARELGVARGGGQADAVRDAEVVFLTVPWPAVDETLGELGDLTGTVVVDVTNPYVGGSHRLHEGTSDAELIQRKIPGARVVKGWNTVYAPVLADPSFDGQAASVFLASDDEDAKATVAQLARDMGFDPIDAGPLAAARDLERLLSTYGAIGHGLPWGSWALKVLRREATS
jgi:8-hydroxy-5-deazaflavin:NADPH oxidoreductase